MRPLLGLLLALTLLAGCGDDTGADAPRESAEAGTPTEGPVDFDHVAVVSQTAVGGHVDPHAVDLTDPEEFDALVAQFDDSRMEDALRQKLEETEVADGQTLAGAVVAVGCIPPSEVEVEYVDGGLEVTAIPDKRDATVDCLAAVTSVAVVAVDASLV